MHSNNLGQACYVRRIFITCAGHKVLLR